MFYLYKPGKRQMAGKNKIPGAIPDPTNKNPDKILVISAPQIRSPLLNPPKYKILVYCFRCWWALRT